MHSIHKLHRHLYGYIVASGETCAHVASYLHISPQAFSKKINGKSSFTAEEMASIGTLFDFSEADYYTYFILPILKRRMDS